MRKIRLVIHKAIDTTPESKKTETGIQVLVFEKGMDIFQEAFFEGGKFFSYATGDEFFNVIEWAYPPKCEA